MAPGLAAAVEVGRARFRDRFKAHQQQQAQRAADEAGAGELVGRWERLLTGFNAALPGLDRNPAAYVPARDALLGFGQEVRGQPGAAAVLREQGEAFGMAKRPNLARVVADARPERVVSGIVKAAEDQTRVRLQEQAVQERAAQEAAREAARRQAAERQSRRQGPSMGM